jgi:hypothetical protein
MNETIKKLSNAVDDLTAENKDLKQQLSKTKESLNVSGSPTATKEPKKIKYQKARSIMNAIYPSRKLEVVEVDSTDADGIKKLVENNYTLLS